MFSPNIDNPTSKTKKKADSTLRKRVRRKALTQAFVRPFIQEFSLKTTTCYKQYMHAYYCSNSMKQKNGKIVTDGLCKTRMCQKCSAIRTANLINGYGEQLNNYFKKKQVYFVTLTSKTCHWTEATKKYTELSKTFNLIRKSWNQRKNMPKFKGLRKVEFTARPNGKVHFHYHLLVVGKKGADFIQSEWLRRLGSDAHKNAQKVIQADKGCQKELFKYISKNSYEETLPGGGKKKCYVPKGPYLKVYNAAYCALKGKRLLQPFGGLKKVSEDIKEELLEAQSLTDAAPARYVWSRDHVNYLNEYTGEHIVDRVMVPSSVRTYLGSYSKDPSPDLIVDKAELRKEQRYVRNVGQTQRIYMCI